MISPFGDILNSQQNDSLFSRYSLNLPGIQKHYAPANGSKIVLDLIVIEGCLLGEEGDEKLRKMITYVNALCDSIITFLNNRPNTLKFFREISYHYTFRDVSVQVLSLKKP